VEILPLSQFGRKLRPRLLYRRPMWTDLLEHMTMFTKTFPEFKHFCAKFSDRLHMTSEIIIVLDSLSARIAVWQLQGSL